MLSILSCSILFQTLDKISSSVDPSVPCFWQQVAAGALALGNWRIYRFSSETIVAGQSTLVQRQLAGQASVAGLFENPWWPNQTPRGWVPPCWRNEREEANGGFAIEIVREEQADRKRARAAESLKEYLKARRREEQLDKWLEEENVDEVDEIEDGRQRTLGRASQVFGGQ